MNRSLRSICLHLGILLLLTCDVFSAEVTVDYSFPHIAHVNPPEEAEGAVTATFVGDAPMVPVEDYPGLVQESPNVYKYTFAWDEFDGLEFSFSFGDEDTVSVMAQPEPVMAVGSQSHSIPVIQLYISRDDLWDPETGIYTWGNYDNCFQRGEEWERYCRFTYSEPGGSVAIDEDAGVRIAGQWSRHYNQKGLRLYFDHYGESDDVFYNFFGSQPIGFQRLILRTGRSLDKYVNSTTVETMFRNLGNLGSRDRFVAVYLNDEYWGAYSLRERYDEEFVDDTHGLADEDFILVKDQGQVHGLLSVWTDFLDSFSAVDDPTSHEWFDSVRRELDLQSFMDWKFLNILTASSEAGFGHNLALLKVGDGQWKHLMWDEDTTFRPENLYSDHFVFYTSQGEAEFIANSPPNLVPTWSSQLQKYCTMFDVLMQNAEFRSEFSNRVDSLMAGPLSVDSWHTLLDSLHTVQNDEIAYQRMRWMGHTQNGHTLRVNTLKQWIEDRMPLVADQKEAFFEAYQEPINLIRFDVIQQNGESELTWHSDGEAGVVGFVLYRSVGDDSNMTPIASWSDSSDLLSHGDSEDICQYAFVDLTAGETQACYYQLSYVDGFDNEHFLNWIAHDERFSYSDLVINELLARNNSGISDEEGEFEDWVEILNTGTTPVNLDGLFMTDNLNQPDRWAFPAAILEPNEHMVIWCDDDDDDGPLHASFKLSSSGEEVGIFSYYGDELVPVDTVVYGPQAADVSYGRIVDGHETWGLFSVPTPGQPNFGAVSVPSVSRIQAQITAVYPNPFNPVLNIDYTLPMAGNAEITVFDLLGRKVAVLMGGWHETGHYQASWFGTNSNGAAMASGTYLIRLEMAGYQHTRQVLLLR